MSVLNYSGVQLQKGAGPKTFFDVKAGDGLVTGTALTDKFTGGGAGLVMAGGAGDDTYCITVEGGKVVERAGEGIDTVEVAGIRAYELDANVENMLVYGRTTAIGNELNNIITGTGMMQVLDGGKGDDVITGGGGYDTFVFSQNSGRDIITDFSVEAGEVIRLAGGQLTSFEQVRANLTQVGADALLNLSGQDSILLRNVDVNDLTAQHFQFAIDLTKFHLTFEDNFDTFNVYNAQTHQGVWDVRGSGAANHEGVYVDPNSGLGVNPYSIDNGVLTITAERASAEVQAATGHAYTSGNMNTRDTFYQQYGYFEMSAALPQEQGAWPAFWLLPSGPANYRLDGEIDIMEQVANGFSHQAVHYGSGGKRINDGNDVYMGDTSDFHTYGLLWTAEEIAWYIDGVEVYSIETPDNFHRPMFIIANLAIGGGWAGSPDADFVSAEMQIDYIRAYEVNATATSGSVNTAPSAPARAPDQKAAARVGTEGDDRLLGSSGDDHLKGAGGADLLRGSGGNDTLDGGAGLDTADYAGSTRGVTVNLTLTTAQDTGGAGLDTLISIENVSGTNLADVLTGDAASNVLDGEGENDILSGGAGDDTLNGGAGDDTLDGGAGRDVINGGGGKDTVTYATATAAVTVDLEATGAQNTGGGGVDTIKDVENIIGSQFGDSLSGGRGNNTIFGGAGADVIDGGAGADIIVGGAGADVITGGGGQDVFKYVSVSDSAGAAFDTIYDYRNNDRFDFSAIDANVNLAGDQAFKFIGNAQFSGQAGQIRTEYTDGLHIYADVNGDRVADMHILLLGKDPGLVAGDFLL